jgi:hypothetical protein
MELSKPFAEILVEGELSPFEHEALYKLLKKHFRLGSAGVVLCQIDYSQTLKREAHIAH